MFRFALMIAGLLLSAVPATARECVILLHGLARSEASMRLIEEVLVHRGYTVVNQGYPSTKDTIEPLSMITLDVARAVCKSAGDETPSAITHSMGGILLRSYASSEPEKNWGPVVMLGPPNQGSEVIDAFGKYKLFEAANGSAALQLGTDGLPARLPAVPFSVGVIAGSQSINPLLSYVVPGQDDGKVAVEKTKVAGMCGHIILPVTHTFMLQHPQVIAQAISYLETGGFEADLSYGDAVKRLALLDE